MTLSLITMRVGIDVMPNACARSGCASVSTLAKTRSPCFSEARSKIGPNIRHGPHHDAQKSTRARSAPPTTSSKFSAESSTVATNDLRPCGDRTLRYPPGHEPALRYPHSRTGHALVRIRGRGPLRQPARHGHHAVYRCGGPDCGGDHTGGSRLAGQDHFPVGDGDGDP